VDAYELMAIRAPGHLLFSFSQGHGTDLYFLCLCCVAQALERIRIKRKKTAA